MTSELFLSYIDNQIIGLTVLFYVLIWLFVFSVSSLTIFIREKKTTQGDIVTPAVFIFTMALIGGGVITLITYSTVFLIINYPINTLIIAGSLL